jgi:hypothetical protein
MTDDWREIDPLTAVTIIRELVGDVRVLPGFTCRLGEPPVATGALLIQFASGIELDWSPIGIRLRYSPALQRDWPAPDEHEQDRTRVVSERARREVRAAMGSQCDVLDPLTGIMHEPEPFGPREAARFYDVPPWLVATDLPPPSFARLRWRLRRVWPRLVWPS